MQVTATNPTAALAPTADTSASPPSTLDYSAFLRLLIAEMKNQDPTKPMDSAQFVAQLASFSGVEQAVKTNAKLDALMSAFALTQAEGFIGRTIVSADGSVAGTVVSVRVASDGAVAFLDNGQSIVLGPGITVA
jgi:flagellar basal-body rod modification protein FlgD